MNKVLEDVLQEHEVFTTMTHEGRMPDENHSQPGWITLIVRAATQSFSFAPTHAIDYHFFRRGMVNAAALCIAAAEWCDRNIEKLKDATP